MATRNRPEAVALSLPLLIAQDRPPRAIHVIDSSDDPDPVRDIVVKAAQTSNIPCDYHRSAAGLPLQRNMGLELVDADVVLLPDDDSLFFSDAMAHIMRLYDRDDEGLIAGIGAADAPIAPEASALAAGAYQRRFADVIRARVALRRHPLEKRVLPDPFHLVADRLVADLPDGPDWLNPADGAQVSWITGYRMSFRTNVIRDTRFDTALGRYALCEDVDACFGALKHGCLVGARLARVYHHRVPARRSNGRAMGGMQILNRAYVCAKTGKVDAEVRSALHRFSRYKVAQYSFTPWSSFGRDRVRAARDALQGIDTLLDAGADDLRDLYLAERERVFSGVD